MDKKTIKKTVCRVCGIPTESLKEKTKRREVTDARKIIAFLLFDMGYCKSVKEVSQEIGLCRNSGYSVMVCFRELLKYDPLFQE